MLELACLFALDGDTEARQAVYDAFERNASNNYSDGSEQIIRIDGLDGLRHVVRRLPAVLEDEEDRDPVWWVDALEERDGKDQAWVALEQAAEAEPVIARLLAVVRVDRTEGTRKRQATRKPERASGYDELLELVAQGRKLSRIAWTWGRRASDANLLRAAGDLLDETDPERLITFLRVFRERRFPMDHTRLLELAQTDDRDIAFAALDSLRNIEHPSVRALALEILQGPGWRERIVAMRHVSFVIKLLEKNFLPEDRELLDLLADETDIDPDIYHWTAMGIQGVLDANDFPERASIHLKLYENTPCSLCRKHTVESLLELGALPDGIREECWWDASLYTREVVSGQTASTG